MPFKELDAHAAVEASCAAVAWLLERFLRSFREAPPKELLQASNK